MKVRGDVEVHRGGRRRPFHYSLRSMFVVTTAAAVAISLLVAAPGWLMMLVFMFLGVAIPVAVTIGAIYGRGAIGTFCMGAWLPASLLPTLTPKLWKMSGIWVFPRGLDLEERLLAMLLMVVQWAVIAGFGLLAVWCRRLVEARQRKRAEGSTPFSQPKPPTAPEKPPTNTEDSSD